MYNTHQKILITLLGLGMLGAIIAFIAGLYNGRKETPVEADGKIEWGQNFEVKYVEEKYPISVIEESEKCKELGGKFDIDISADVFGKELNMKCEKVIPVTTNLKNTETLFNYSLFINK